MAVLALRPMTVAEYDSWVPGAIEDYAEQHAAAGSRPADTALELAGQEFAELLPDGVATAEHHLLVGEVDGTRVGMLWLRVRPGSETATFVYDVTVDRELRGRGYGRALMLAAESYSAERGARAIKLHVFGDNTEARRLYESLGYVATNITMAKPLTG